MQDLEQVNTKYYNYFTTPSGIECSLYEITNKEYLVLLKFLQSENFTGFFKCLDCFIKRTIKDFDNFLYIDKIYTYIAFAFYNIKPNVSISHPKLGPTDLSLTNLLGDIESAFVSKAEIIEINDSIKIKIHYARKFHYEADTPIVDYDTCICEIAKNGEWQKISPVEASQLMEVLDTQTASKIEIKARNAFNNKINIFKLPMMNPVYADTNSADMLYLVCSLFKENLQNYYTELYIATHYMKMDKYGFDTLTPVEMSIVLKIMEEDKEKQNKQSKNKGGMAIPSAISEDTLL